MGNFLYWALRTLIWVLLVTTVYFAILRADGRLWLQILLVGNVVVIFSLIDQPLRDMRGRSRRR